MKNYLKTLAEVLQELGKVLDELATDIAKLTLVAMAIISLIQLISHTA